MQESLPIERSVRVTPILPVPESRCSGKCCEIFWLGYSYREICDPKRNFIDGDKIRAMVIPLYWEATEKDTDLLWYTCKHHRSNGDCGIYQERPKMCRDYPYGGVCGFAGCTFGHNQTRINRAKLRVMEEKLEGLTGGKG